MHCNIAVLMNALYLQIAEEIPYLDEYRYWWY